MSTTHDRGAVSEDQGSLASAEDLRLVEALRRRDEAAFATLVDRYNSTLLRVARMYVPSSAVAEEVVQETWLGVLKGIDRFEGRSSLKTWIFRILTNTAKTRGERESRSIPFASASPRDSEGNELGIGEDRFFSPEHDRHPGHWSLGPTPWPTPEESLLTGETREAILTAIEDLPHAQKEVITLRDIEGWPSKEVCNALEVTETNQRVLLHRARSKVRAALERHFEATERTT